MGFQDRISSKCPANMARRCRHRGNISVANKAQRFDLKPKKPLLAAFGMTRRRRAHGRTSDACGGGSGGLKRRIGCKVRRPQVDSFVGSVIDTSRALLALPHLAGLAVEFRSEALLQTNALTDYYMVCNLIRLYICFRAAHGRCVALEGEIVVNAQGFEGEKRTSSQIVPAHWARSA